MMKMNAAEEHRLEQARALLRSLGFVEMPDGNFAPPPELEKYRPRLDMDHPVLQDTPEG